MLSQFKECPSPGHLSGICFSFLLGITADPKELENNAYAKFWGANKVHYGKCGSGVLRAKATDQSPAQQAISETFRTGYLNGV